LKKKNWGGSKGEKGAKKSLKKSLFRGGGVMVLSPFQRQKVKKVTEKSLSGV
jgi:hypothetical protein